MATMALRDVRPSDVPALQELWSRAVGPLFPLRSDVLIRCLSRGGVLRREVVGRVVERGDVIVGFAYLTTRDRSAPDVPAARLQAILVDPADRRRGLASTLLDELATAARHDGATALECGGGHDYLWPAIPTDLPDGSGFLTKAGFTMGGTSYDVRSTADTMAAARRTAGNLPALGVSVGPVDSAAVDAVLAFIAEEFDPAWAVDLREALEDGLSLADLLVARDAAGDPVGFARIHRDIRPPIGPPLFWSARIGPDTGGLGPIGVAASRRGRGLGRALLGQALLAIAERGARDIVIDFTDQLSFYGPLGFVPWLTYRHASRPL